MNANEELNNFLVKTYELITCKYILAESKLVGVLKSIAGSETLYSVIESAVTGFNYEVDSKKYFTESSLGNSNHGEYLAPENMKDLIALTFITLVKIDGGEINFSEFLQRYFYEDGSFSESYSAFVTRMIKPFRNAIKTYMEGVISGKVKTYEGKVKPTSDDKVLTTKLDELHAVDESALKKAKGVIEADKIRVTSCELTEDEKTEILIVADNLLNAIESSEKERIKVAFISYKHTALAFKKAGIDVDKLAGFFKIAKVL